MKIYTHPISTIISNGGPAPSDYQLLNESLRIIWNDFKQGLIKEADLDKLKESLSEILCEDTMQGFAFIKPHGYAGDYEIIDRIYTKWMSPREHLRKWDEYFHSQDAPKAVRNRKMYLHNLLNKKEKVFNRPIKILNIGSGPGRDMFEYFLKNSNSSVLFECVDIDSNAIQHAKGLCDGLPIVFHCKNIFRFRTTQKYDLVWSAGLFDYLNDKQFKFLLKHLTSMVNDTGELVIGNFSDTNPSQPYMEIFGEWYLQHRSNEKLIQLVEQCGIDKESVRVEREHCCPVKKIDTA